MVKSTLAALLLLASVSGPLPAVESIQLDKASALPIEFKLVKRCGSWQAGARQGYYRVIVADVYDGAGSELYVQWIEEATQEAHPVVVKTLTFPELNNDHNQYDFVRVECERKGPSTYVRARATYEHDEADKTHDISIRLVDIGKYELSERAEPLRSRRK